MDNVKTWSPEQAEKGVSLTEAAIQHVKKIMAKEQGVALRFGVKKSGCSGMAYTVEVVKDIAANDHVFSVSAGMNVVVDPKSFLYVNGTTIDYVRIGLNSQFKFHNPNEKASCGCGESFSIDEDAS